MRSPSLTMPSTRRSASTTGTPLMRRSSIIVAISRTGVSGPTEMTSLVMIPLAFMGSSLVPGTFAALILVKSGQCSNAGEL